MSESPRYILVSTYEMTAEQCEAMFDRVADAAHALDEQVTVTAGPLADLPLLVDVLMEGDVD